MGHYVPHAPPAGAAAHERVKILRLGWSLSATALLAVAPAERLLAQQPERAPASIHTVKRGDTLWDIAKSYLGDSYLWPEIYRLNTDKIEDPHWIYPGEVLRLVRAQAAAAAEEQASPAPAAPSQTVFSPRPVVNRRLRDRVAVLQPHVRIGDIIRASYFGPQKGPANPGRILYSADIPGIDKAHGTTNFQLYDKLLLVPPAGRIPAERDRFVAYSLGESVEDVGTVVIPTALLEVTRAPRGDEATIVQVVALYGELNADSRVVALDTAGAGALGLPSPVSSGRVARIRSIQRPVVLASMQYEVLFDLSSRDGMKIGDEVEFFRAREKAVEGERPSIPEVRIGTGQVIRVTPFGTTARITSQAQPDFRVNESVRVVARMP